MTDVSASNHIHRAIRHAGSQHRLSRETGLSQQFISKLSRGERRPSAETAIAIEKATDGVVPKWLIRPDLWEEPLIKEGIKMSTSPSETAPS